MKIPPSSRLQSALVALLLVLCVAACTSDPPTAPTLTEGEIMPEELYSSSNSGITESTRRVVRQQTAFEALWDDVFSDGSTPPDQPVVDFNRDMVIAVAAGEQMESCHAIEITRATSDGTDLSVTVTETGPPAGCDCDPTMVQPVLIVSTPRADQVFFREATVTACPD
jgi:hypothetical protein